MSMDELIYRLKDRFNEFWHSEKRSVKAFSRFMAFTLFAAVISTIAPTLADELATSPEMQQPAPASAPVLLTEIIETPTPTATPTATFTPEPEISRPVIPVSSENPHIESSESTTAELPGVPLETQTAYLVKAPATIAVDPRALNRFMPHIYISNPDPDVVYTMVCVSGVGLTFDVKQKGVANNQSEGVELISGDLSGQVLISASTGRAIELLNSYQGLFATSSKGGISGRSITMRFVAVSKPVVDPTYCGYARSGALTSMRALALDQSTVKGGGKLK